MDNFFLRFPGPISWISKSKLGFFEVRIRTQFLFIREQPKLAKTLAQTAEAEVVCGVPSYLLSVLPPPPHNNKNG